jgi:radical SAM protein with 4Fe4S-binding SPASM domain
MINVTADESEYNLQELKIEVTHKCPLICVHCSSDATPLCGREMSREKCFSIINEAIGMGVKDISISGGEPLVYPYIVELVKLINSYNIHVSLYTCGNVLNKAEIFKSLKQAGLDRVIFSLYSNDDKEHDRITRTPGSFIQTLSAISEANINLIPTELHFVAMKNNYHKLSAVINLAQSCGISRVSVLRFVPQGRGALLDNQVLGRVDNLNLRRTIIQLRNSGFDIRTGSPWNVLRVNEHPECNSGINRIIVSPDMKIFPCDAFKQIFADEVTGTIEYSDLNYYSLSDCWNYSPYLQLVRKSIKQKLNAICSSCMNLQQCESGCLAQKVIKYGSFVSRPDPDCLNSLDSGRE